MIDSTREGLECDCCGLLASGDVVSDGQPPRLRMRGLHQRRLRVGALCRGDRLRLWRA